MSLRSVAQRFNVSTCVSCNKCFDVCPIHWADSRFDPSELAAACLDEGPLDEKALFTLWTCTGCRACLSRCPEAAPDFASFAFEVRSEARRLGHRPPSPYGGAMEILRRLSADHRLSGRRSSALPQKWRRPPEEGAALLYLGALPFIADVVEPELGARAVRSVIAGLELLEALGVSFGVLDDETDCGHDLIWTGDRLTFKTHARRLREQIAASNVKTVIPVNEEAADTLKHEFPSVGYPIDAQVVTLSDYLARHAGALRFAPSNKKVAVHVESRRADEEHRLRQLARALEHVPETEVVELPEAEPMPQTVGVKGFAVCGGWAAALQNRLLAAAEKSGAEALVLAGVNGVTHLRCSCRQGAWCRSAMPVLTAAEFLREHLLEGDEEGVAEERGKEGEVEEGDEEGVAEERGKEGVVEERGEEGAVGEVGEGQLESGAVVAKEGGGPGGGEETDVSAVGDDEKERDE